MNLECMIEAVLFYKTEPMRIQGLSTFFEVSEKEITDALASLHERLAHGATRLIQTDDTVQLVTAAEAAPAIEKLRKEELAREIGKAGAETLAIVLYRGPVTRAEIDFIRGVNSSFILRNLQIRGLIERIDHPTLPRTFQYQTTASLLAHLGVSRKEDMPDYVTVMNTLDTYEKESATESTNTPA